MHESFRDRKNAFSYTIKQPQPFFLALYHTLMRKPFPFCCFKFSLFIFQGTILLRPACSPLAKVAMLN
jgi:hypothetical protein